ncbi:CRP/FNR family transcriptional regulator, anaerobic regulatory protein [Mariniphaga anaerophila]|uniref:CRP/FNR family transcriptional regulator, anaerobic regulatory protein n=1 Tax=Mariniphaga anaerophila TaxID=1484053 RepID=A0A1M4WB07_9BACT|nr:Crp/Fnr family transcriptional regulator [Mariniphaga anaerophila]SHE78340.1 CRP/FNR family transcriptional regulator, anaerobic regulatory protein [Mariniphaga anaerophila]
MSDRNSANNSQHKGFTSLEKDFQGALSQLAQNKTRIAYLKGETIFKQGAFAPYVLYVVSGLIKVYLQTGYDKQVNINLAKTGDFLAFSSIFGENIHTYSAQALKDSEICMIEKESLKDILLQNPQFALEITSKNYRNERHLLEIIKNISYKQMRGKLASSLIYLSQEDFLKENVFEFLTRQELADFASISTESAIKFLKEFEKENIVVLDGKNISITDKKKLETISKTS